MGSQLRSRKESLLAEIKVLDAKANGVRLSMDEWARRYAVEGEMTFILTCEEMYWKQRGQQRWILKGDASMDYFHVSPTEDAGDV